MEKTIVLSRDLVQHHFLMVSLTSRAKKIQSHSAHPGHVLVMFFLPSPVGSRGSWLVFESVLSKTIPTDHWNIQYPRDPKSPTMKDSFQKQVVKGMFQVSVGIFFIPKTSGPKLVVNNGGVLSVGPNQEKKTQIQGFGVYKRVCHNHLKQP